MLRVYFFYRFFFHLQDGGNNDIWDDTALIKAYDDAVTAMQVVQ